MKGAIRDEIQARLPIRSSKPHIGLSGRPTKTNCTNLQAKDKEHGARGGTRTRKAQRPGDFKSPASANSATQAKSLTTSYL